VPWVPSRFFVSDTVGRIWLDMVSEVDFAIGSLLDLLQAKGIEDNTVVIVTSDNGPYLEFASTFCPQNCRNQVPNSGKPENWGCTICARDTVSLPGPLKGGKGQVFEGGVRVPGIWRWPGKIPAGTVNPTITSSLDFLPTAVALAGGAVLPDVPLDGRDISETLFNPPAADSEPTGEFFYWCGAQIFAVRMGRHKVFFVTQKHVGKTINSTTPADYCAQTGQCCVGSPTRLCSCFYVEVHDPPLVLDLVSNIGENLSQRLDPASPDTQALVHLAATRRLEKLRSVGQERGRLQPASCGVFEKKFSTTVGSMSAVQLMEMLPLLPALMTVDECYGSKNQSELPLPLVKSLQRCGLKPDEPVGCPAIPVKCQMPEFSPYENCSLTTPMGRSCANRRPCGQQSGYLGPFEHVNPGLPDGNESWCGAFLQPGGTSYYPERLLASVCEWQDRFPAITWCRPQICATAESDQQCRLIEQFGLNNVPTGMIWNEAYPDDHRQSQRQPTPTPPREDQDEWPSSSNILLE
ncbi:unnamed protein product, partial [Polarella glacialis]